MTDQIRALIQSIVTHARVDDYSDTDSLIDAGVLDSLAIMQIVTMLEQRYAIKVDIDELLPDNFDTIERIVGFVAGKTAAATAK